jgi:hypothetical protein
MRCGRGRDWQDSDWKILDMGGYGCGAEYLLHNALKRNYLRVAEWALTHGANPNPPRASDPRTPASTLSERAVRNGLTAFAALLARSGAAVTVPPLNSREEFAAACFHPDRPRAQALLAEYPDYLHDPGPLLIAAERDRADVSASCSTSGCLPISRSPAARRGRFTSLRTATRRPDVRTATRQTDGVRNSRTQISTGTPPRSKSSTRKASWLSQNAFCREPLTCGCKRRSNSDSGCNSCSSLTVWCSTENGLFEPV